MENTLALSLFLFLYFVGKVKNQEMEYECIEGCICTMQHSHMFADCHDAEFTAIPGFSTELKVLRLDGNNISDLFGYIFQEFQIVKLEALFLSDCQIKTVDRDAFRGLEELIILDLSENRINTIHIDGFESNTKLKMLQLNNNPLTVLSGDIFPPLHYLIKIELQNCKLSEFKNGIFDYLTNLEQLDLSANNFTFISEELFQPLPKLKLLTLHDNPWHCVCQLRPFLKWVMKDGLSPPRTNCHAPNNGRSVDWSALDLNAHCPSKMSAIPVLEYRAQCEAKDRFGNLWNAYAEETLSKNCMGDIPNEFATWYCSRSGNFEGENPKFDNCSSKWLEVTEDEISKTEGLNVSSADALLTRIENKTNSELSGKEQEYYGHEIKRVLELGTKILKQLPNNTELEVFENLTGRTVDIKRNVITNDVPFNELTMHQRSETGNEFLTSLEDSGLELASRVGVNDTTFGAYRKSYDQATEFKIIVGVQYTSLNQSIPRVFPYDHSVGDSYMELPLNFSNHFTNITSINMIGIQINPDLANKLFPANSSISESATKTIINSDIISLSFGSESINPKDSFKLDNDVVRITFRHNNEANGNSTNSKLGGNNHCGKTRVDQNTASCVYWDTDRLIWSSDGCKLVGTGKSSSTCECNHLTAFALLMDVHTHSGGNFGLKILTWIILPLSSLGLLISATVIFTFNQKRSLRNTMTINLCMCLLLGNVMLLVFMDRSYFCLSDVLCSISGTITHFVYLSAFSWMLMDGLYLYRKTEKVFEDRRTYTRLRVIAAYSIPGLIVGITWVVAFATSGVAYGTEDFCWLGNGYIWAFMGPISAIVLGNSCLLVLTCRNLYSRPQVNRTANPGTLEKKQNLSWVKSSFSLTILLGTTWILGFLLLVDDAVVGLIASYSFTIFNASQGIFLFVDRMIIDTRIRSKLAQQMQTNKYWFTRSNATESTTQTANARSRDNESLL